MCQYLTFFIHLQISLPNEQRLRFSQLCQDSNTSPGNLYTASSTLLSGSFDTPLQAVDSPLSLFPFLSPTASGLASSPSSSRNFTKSSFTSNNSSDPANTTLYNCPQCDYQCKKMDNMKKHVRIHSGEKPYVCTICQYRTAQRCNLNTHMKKHHGMHTFKDFSGASRFV